MTRLNNGLATPQATEDLFGKSVGRALLKLLPQRRGWAKIKIQEVLYQAEFEE
eukprot:m.186120 g.186120  ORF g.186120 m.186120 type:complete len:53 (+) comp39339_c0_seq1:698-856(+)